MGTLDIIKKKKFNIPDDLNLMRLWDLISPFVVKEIAPDFLPISSLMDTNAYEIGYIFVRTREKSSCFGEYPLRVLGPIRNFMKKDPMDRRWLAEEFPAEETLPDYENFKLTLKDNENELLFEGQKYYYLNIPDDMVLEKSVIIDRTTDEDLLHAEWIGLITDALVTEIFQLKVETKNFARTLYIGDKHHVVLFDYELYKIDSKGKLRLSSCRVPDLPWEGLQCECQDGLPLPSFE